MKNKTVTLPLELVDASVNGAEQEQGRARNQLRAALAVPVPPAGEDRLPERPYASEDDQSTMTDYEIGLGHGGCEMWDKFQPHVTRLQAEVGRLKAEAGIYRTGYALLKEEHAALQAELTEAREDLSTANDKLRRQDIASQYKDGQIAKHEGELAMLQAELTKAREELDTLRHAVWHALDDSEENAQTGEVTLSRYDFDELSTLVPEEWHDAYHNQSAQAAKGDGLSGTFSISPQQQEAQITVTDLRGVAPWEPAPVAVAPDLNELREYHANAVEDLEHYADDWNLRESDVKNYRKRAEFHRRQVALLDSLRP